MLSSRTQDSDENTQATRRGSITKLMRKVTEITLMNRSIENIRLRQRQRDLHRRLLQKEIVNLESEEDCEFVIYILQRPSRTKDQLHYLRKAFVDLKFFKEKSQMLNESLYHLLFKNIRHTLMKQSSVVFHYGQQGDSYYIILKGQVALLLPVTQDEQISYEQAINDFDEGVIHYNSKHMASMQETQGRPFMLNRMNSVESMSMNANEPNKQRKSSMLYDVEQQTQKMALKDIIKAQAMQKFFNSENYSSKENQYVDADQKEQELQTLSPRVQDYIHLCFPRFKLTKLIGPGDSFGEIALITSQMRTATIICTEDTHFMTLHKEEFQNILEIYRFQIQTEKLVLLRNFPLFQTLSGTLLHQFIDHMLVISPRMFDIIYLENQKADYLYIIKEGEVELDHLVQQTNRNKHVPQKRVSLSLLQQGSIFGHEDILKNQFRSHRAVSKSSNCELYLVPAKIVRNVSAKYGNLSALLTQNEDLQKLHQKAINNAQKQLKQQYESQQEFQDLNTYLSSNLQVEENQTSPFSISSPLDLKQSTKLIEQTQKQIYQNHYRIIKSKKTAEQLESHVQFYKPVFQTDFKCVARMNRILLGKSLNRKKSQVQSQQLSPQNTMSKFEPFFSLEYLRQLAYEKNMKNGRQHSKKKQITSSPSKSPTNCPLHSSISTQNIKMRSLFKSVFKDSNEEQMERIIPTNKHSIQLFDCQLSQFSKIDVGMNFEQPCSYSPQQPQHQVVNIHSHLFSPKLSARRIKLNRIQKFS